MVGWKYGTHDLAPYRKYRTAKGELHKITACPLDEQYISGQHVGKWAVKLAQGGADGMLIDMEMYHSDTSWLKIVVSALPLADRHSARLRHGRPGIGEGYGTNERSP